MENCVFVELSFQQITFIRLFLWPFVRLTFFMPTNIVMQQYSHITICHCNNGVMV